jgi:hypothetical protein
VLGTENLVHHVCLVLRHVSSGASLLAHVDRLAEDDVTLMMTRLLGTPGEATGCDDRYAEKKENIIFLIYREIQNGAVAKSYMTNGLLIYGEIFAHFLIY